MKEGTVTEVNGKCCKSGAKVKQRLIEPDFAKMMDFLDKGSVGDDCIELDSGKSRLQWHREEVGQGEGFKGG